MTMSICNGKCLNVLTYNLSHLVKIGVKYSVREALFGCLKIVVQALPHVFIFTQLTGPQTRLIKHIAALEYFAPMCHLLCSRSSLFTVGETFEMHARVIIESVVFQCAMQH
jgi:hypothetical protein